MPRTTGPSVLEGQLKQIVHDHPRVRVHPASGTGPYVRAVMWQANPRILGQAFWEPETGRWVVRAVDLTVGESSLVTEHPASMDAISDAITSVLARLT